MSSIGYEERATVIFIKNSNILLWNLDFIKDGPEIKGHAPSIAGSKKFGLAGAQAACRLDTTLPSNSCFS